MNEFRDIQKSLLRFCNTFVNDQNQFGKNLMVVNMDLFSTPLEWPKQDFLGIGETQYDFDQGVITITTAFAVSTINDENMFRMDEVINSLLNVLDVGMQVPIFDAIGNFPRGNLVVTNGIRAGAVLKTDSQPVRPVFARFKSDQVLRRP